MIITRHSEKINARFAALDVERDSLRKRLAAIETEMRECEALIHALAPLREEERGREGQAMRDRMTDLIESMKRRD